MYSNEQQHFPRPFLSCPDPEAYYPAETIQQARTTVFRALDRGEGLALVFGSAGVGKTLLARLLADEFELHAPVLRMTGFRFPDRKSFLSRILFELKNEPVEEGEEVRLHLIDYFRRTEYRRFFLFIDDAEQLPLFVFDEIRMLLDLTNGRDVRFRAALFGAGRLEDRLNHPKLARFSQRIVARCWLEPFTAPETAAYLDAQTYAHKTPPFTPEAKKRLHTLSDGIPRRINQIADLALWFGPTAGNAADAIDETVVQKSWNRLEQIPDETAQRSSSPAAAADSSADSSAGSVVEFGTLDDDEPDGFASDRPTAVMPEGGSPDSPPEATEEPDAASEISLEPAIELSSGPLNDPPIPLHPSEMAAMSFTDPAFNAPADAEPNDDFIDELEEESGEELDDADDSDDADDEEWEEPGEIDAELEQRLQQRLQESMQTTDIQTPPALDAPILDAPALDTQPESDEFYGIPTLKFPVGGERSGSGRLDREESGANSRITPVSNRAGYLEELRLLEMEVEQEAKVIRKIREMQSGLTTFPLPEDSAQTGKEEKQDQPRSSEPKSENTPQPGRSKMPLHPFRSAFERLYRDDSPKEN